MPVAPLQAATVKWRQRSTAAAAQGIPSSAYYGLMQQDLSNVASGRTAMSDAQVNAAILSVASGQDVIKPPDQSHGIEGFLSNIGTDIGGMVKGFIPGMAHLIAHLPSEVASLPKDIAEGPQGWVKDPLLSLIPGEWDVASVLSGQAHNLYQHPVGALLDVAPLAGSVGKVALAGRAAEGSLEAGTAAEALSQGRVYQAAGRSASDAISSLTQGKVDPRRSLQTAANRLTITQPIRELTRVFNVEGKKGTKAAHDYFLNNIRPWVEGYTPEQLRDLVTAASHRGDPGFDLAGLAGGDTALAARYHQSLEGLDRVAADIHSMTPGVESIPDPNGGKNEIFSSDSPVAESHRKWAQAQNDLAHLDRQIYGHQHKMARAGKFLGPLRTKVRAYGEADQSFNSRHEAPINVDALYQAYLPFRSAWTSGRIPADIKAAGLSGKLNRQANRTLLADQKVINASLVRLEQAFQDRNFRAIQTSITKLGQALSHKSWNGIVDTSAMLSWLKEMRQHSTGLRDKERTYRYFTGQHQSMQRQLDTMIKKRGQRQARVNGAKKDFLDKITYTPSARFQPLIEEAARKGLTGAVKELNLADEVEAHVLSDPTMNRVKTLLGSDEFNNIIRSNAALWLDMKKEGYDPVWVHQVHPGRYDHILNVHALTKRMTPSVAKKTVLNFEPKYANIAVSFADAAAEIFRDRAADAFVDYILKTPGTVTEYDELLTQFGKMYDNMGPRLAGHEDRGTWIRDQIIKNYEQWNPDQYGLSSSPRIAHTKDLWVDKGTARAFRLMSGDYNSPFRLLTNGAWARTLSLYKFSVLTGPRHLIHVAVAGWMFSLLRDERSILQIGNAIHDVKAGNVDMRLQQALYHHNEPDALWGYKAGQTLGRHYAQAIGDKARALQRFEEFAANVQRQSVYLGQIKRGADVETAVKEALRTFIDMDGMSPVERSILKQVFPFYAFTRHLFRYLFELPVDHPYRAAILSRFGNQEQEEWDSRIPTEYQQMLFLGHPNPATGNVTAVDYKNINPFRSIASDFSLAGFASSLNPVASTALQMFGVNVLTGTPDLYPGVDYNPTTGSLTATRPSFGTTLIQTYIPETQGLAAVFGFNQRMKALKQASPGAYTRELYNAFNIPFARSQVNIPEIEARQEANLYRGAQQALSTATDQGQWSEAMDYNLVPYQGELVPPADIAALYAALSGQLPSGVSPRALIAPIRRPSPGALRIRLGNEVVG